MVVIGGMDKPSGLEYLLTWLGLEWPEGDEDKMWDLAGDWHDAAKSLSDIDGDIDAAIGAVQAAYPEGSGGEAMIKQLQSMRSGPQSIDQLVAWFNHVGDSAQSTGDSIEGGKIQFETLLLTTAAALLAEEAFPPTAPAEQAATIAISRVGARLAMRQLLKAIAENGLKDVLLTTLKNQWQRILLHLVLDATIPAGVNLANQEAKVQSGHQNGIHWDDVGKTAVEGLAGGLTGGFAGGLMQGWMRNLSSGLFKGLVAGIAGGATGTLASSLVDIYGYNGSWDQLNPSALGLGAIWGAHGAMIGHHGVSEDGSAPHPRVNLTDEGGAPGERVSIPSDGQDGGSPHVEPTGSSAGEHSPSTGEHDSDPGQQHSSQESDSNHPAGSDDGTEKPGTQSHSTPTEHDGPPDSRPAHETPSEAGPKIHSTGTDGASPESHSAESHSAPVRDAEPRSEGANFTAGSDHSGARAESAARPEPPVSARSAGSAGDGVRAAGSSPRPQGTGDGSSAYRPASAETRSVPDETTAASADRPLAGSTESPDARPTLDPSTDDPVSVEKPFIAAHDRPIAETPHAGDFSSAGARPDDETGFAVPDDISGIDDTPAPPEPSPRAGLVDNAQRPGDPERPASRIADRPESSSPIRARSTGAEPGARPGENRPRAGDSSRANRAGDVDHPREFVGARARGDDEAPHPNEEHPNGDNGTRPPDLPGEDPRSRAGLPGDHRAGEDGTHSSDHAEQEHHSDHDDYAYAGGAIRPRDDASAFEWADDAYEAFRGTDRDIDDIADVLAAYPREDGTHFSRDDIEQIKNHLFREEHPIRDYDGEVVQRRYDADPDIAEAWIRLRSGDPKPADLVLLEHELAESNYYREHPGSIYQDAHAHANESHNWSEVAVSRTGERYDTLWGKHDGAADLLQPDPGRSERGGVPVRGDEGESGPGADDRQGEQQRPHGPTGGRDLPVGGGSDQAPGQTREGVAPERGDRLVTDSSDRTPQQHRASDHDDSATRLADHERQEPQRDSTDHGHHEDGSPHPEDAGPHERPSIDDAFRDHAEPTDAGLSLHGKDPELSRLAGLVPADDRYFTVDAHVTADGHVRIGEHRYTPEEFGDMLREHGWDGEKPVRMIGCDASENGFAGRLANHLGTDVLAPTEKAWTDESGRVYSSTVFDVRDGNPRPRIPPDGEWHVSHPDGTRTRASDDGFVPGTPDGAKHGIDSDGTMRHEQSPHNRRTIDPSDERLLEPHTEQTIDDRPVVVDENGVPHKIDGEPDSAAVRTSVKFLNDQLEHAGDRYDAKTGNGSRFFVQDDSNPIVPKAVVDGTDSITGTTADLVKVTWRDGRVIGVETFDATTSSRAEVDPESALRTLRNKLPDGSKYQAENGLFVAPSKEWAHAVSDAARGDPRIRVIHPESGFDSAVEAGVNRAGDPSHEHHFPLSGDGVGHAVPRGDAQQHPVPLSLDENRIRGRNLLSRVKELYAPYREDIAATGKKMTVIRFEADPGDSESWHIKMDASQTSAEQKVKTFDSAGYIPEHIVLPPGTSLARFEDLLQSLNEDPNSAGVIVQFPPPSRLAPAVLDMVPGKDVDALLGSRSNFPACATGDGIARIVTAFSDSDPTVAVVGARGFVGSGVVDLLHANGIRVNELDVGSDLREARDADIVVSVTGNPRILGADHITENHILVVDSGFVPRPSEGTILGDVQKEVWDLPQRITPVPGGIGPTEMAVLLERIVRMQIPDAPTWRVTPEGE